MSGKFCLRHGPEAVGDVISDMAVDLIGLDVRAKLGDSRFNSNQIIRLFGRPDPLYAPLLCSI